MVSVPVVVRANAEGYAFIRDAYIHGIMGDEALRIPHRLEELTIIQARLTC